MPPFIATLEAPLARVVGHPSYFRHQGSAPRPTPGTGSLVAAALMSASEPKNTEAMMSEPPSVSSDQCGTSSTVIGPDTAAPGGGFGTVARATDIFAPMARR